MRTASVLAGARREPVAAVSAGVPTVTRRTLAGRPLTAAVRRVDDFDQLDFGARDTTPGELSRCAQWEATA
ncbi:MAG TPA: hypothetical protein VFY17_09805 [Pilimelia sp.]|nr:hypothetical protein [Pilimelia sp.]